MSIAAETMEMLFTGCYGNMLMRIGPCHSISLKLMFLWKNGNIGRERSCPSDTQLIGLGENNFENRHESRGLTEVAGANYVGMDGQSFRVVSRFDAPCNVV